MVRIVLALCGRWFVVIVSGLLLTNAVLARGRNAPRSPTVLDGTFWTVTMIDNKPVESSPLTIGFYNNGRVQITTACSFLMAGDFSVGIFFRVSTQSLDKPNRRLPCGEIAQQEEMHAYEIMDGLRSFRFEDERQSIFLKDARGRVIHGRRR